MIELETEEFAAAARQLIYSAVDPVGISSRRLWSQLAGCGGMAGSAGGILFPIIAGRMLDHFSARNNITADYAILFTICGCSYLVAFALNHLLAPRFEPIQLRQAS